MQHCYNCGAKPSEDGNSNSTHILKIKFECGSVIFVAIGEIDSIKLEKDYPKNKRKY